MVKELCHKEKCFVLWREKPKNEAASIIILYDERAKDSYSKFKKNLFDIFKVIIDSEEIIHFRLEELDPIFSEQEEQEIKKICPHVERCFFLWREKPKGTGESAVIIVPLDKMALHSYETFLTLLLEIFDATTDSEETIDFRMEGLDI